MESLIKFLHFFGLLSLFVFFIGLPLIGFLRLEKNLETNIFLFLIIFSLLSFVIHFIVLILNGKSKLTDPKNFLQVLTFALLTTVASVFVIPSNLSNTFGVENLRAVSGIFIMCAVGLFYILNVYIRDRVLFKRVIYFFAIGFTTLFVYLLATSFGSNLYIPNNIILLSPLYIFIAGILLFSRIPKVFSLTSIVVLILLTILSFIGYTGIFDNLYIVILSLSFTGLMFSLFFIINNRKYINTLFSEIKSHNEKNSQKFRRVGKLIILLSPFLIFLSGFVIQILTKQSYLGIFNSLSEISLGFTNIFNSVSASSNQFVSILFGLGGRILNPDFSLISNIISSQGLVGLFAYLFLGFSATYYGFKLLKDELSRDRDYKLLATMLFLMVYITILSLFTYPGILLVILWWIAFGLISSYPKLAKNPSILRNFEVNKLKRLQIGKVKINYQYFLALGVLFLGVILFLFISRLSI